MTIHSMATKMNYKTTACRLYHIFTIWNQPSTQSSFFWTREREEEDAETKFSANTARSVLTQINTNQDHY